MYDAVQYGRDFPHGAMLAQGETLAQVLHEIHARVSDRLIHYPNCSAFRVGDRPVCSALVGHGRIIVVCGPRA